MSLIMQPQNLVRTIHAIPPSVSGGSRSLLLEIQRSRSVPFVIPKPVTVEPSGVTMSSTLWQGEKEQIQREIARIEMKRERANAFSREDGGILTLPFRQGGFYIGRGFHAVKQAFTNQGLLQFHVKGHNTAWKLEHKTAWALDEGQALDKLVNIKYV